MGWDPCLGRDFQALAASCMLGYCTVLAIRAARSGLVRHVWASEAAQSAWGSLVHPRRPVCLACKTAIQDPMPVSCSARTPPAVCMLKAAPCWSCIADAPGSPNTLTRQPCTQVNYSKTQGLLQGQGNLLACGDVAAAFESPECERIIVGEGRLGGQEHFYLEPQCSVVIPGEHQEFTIISSSQVPPWLPLAAAALAAGGPGQHA